MTRKTQIGLLMTASVLCCAGVFIGARLTNGSHASMDAPKPAVADPIPTEPTPVAEQPKSEPTIVAKIEQPLLPPPDLNPTAINVPHAKAEPESLPPLPPPRETQATRTAPEITLVRAEQPAQEVKPPVNDNAPLPPNVSVDPPASPSDLPPPPPPTAKDGPPPAAADLSEPPPSSEPVRLAPMKQAANAPKELTGKPQVGAGVAQELESPPPIAPIPMPPDNLPAPSVSGPSSPDAGSRIKIESKPVEVGPPPRIAKPDELPPSASESGPPARIVPVSPTTQAPTTSVVTPVLKKQSAVTKAKVLPLTGTHRCTLDAKNGLTLPKAVREQMGEQDTLFITLGSDHCVWLTTAAGLEKLTDRLEKSPAVEDDAKVARRRYFAQTERVTVDKNGYVVVPAALLESAGLKQDAVLIGVGDHLELWDTQRWHKYSQTPGNEPDASAERHDEL